MKICRNLSEVSTELKVEEWETQKAFEKYFLRGNYMKVNEFLVYFEDGGDRIDYVIVDLNDNADCREYMLKYELDNFEWEVKTDDIVGVEKCKVIGIDNTRMGINRATVITETGTQLNRRVVFILDKEDEDYRKDGCIYFWEK